GTPVGGDEAKSLSAVEPLDGAGGHRRNSSVSLLPARVRQRGASVGNRETYAGKRRTLGRLSQRSPILMRQNRSQIKQNGTLGLQSASNTSRSTTALLCSVSLAAKGHGRASCRQWRRDAGDDLQVGYGRAMVVSGNRQANVHL